MGARFRSWWQKIKQYSFIATGIIVVLIVLIAFIFAAYRFGWSGTGFLNKSLWDWLQLLIIPAVLAVAGFWFNQIQKDRDQKAEEAQKQREEDAAQKREKLERESREDNQCETVLQTYIDKMSELLLKEHLGELTPEGKPNSEYEGVRTIARVRTLTVLQQLDAVRKFSVLLFLHESGLIEKGDKCIVKLDIANLKGADLRGIHLEEAQLWGAKLQGADLSFADLSEADLKDVNLHGTNLRGTDLSRAYLSGADLSGVELGRANLSGATLGCHKVNGKVYCANLSGATLDEATLINADLKGAIGTTSEQLNKAKSLQGAIMPDGSIHP